MDEDRRNDSYQIRSPSLLRVPTEETVESLAPLGPSQGSPKQFTRQSRGSKRRGVHVLSPSPSDASEPSAAKSPRTLLSDRNRLPHSPAAAVSDEPDARVSLDFGTTYTTIAYVTRLVNPDRPRLIECTPGDELNGRVDIRQAPSEILYLKWPQGEDQIERYRIRYGYMAQQWVDPNVERGGYEKICHVRRMKLLLDHNEKAADDMAHLRQSLNILKHDNFIKKDKEVIVGYLTWLFKHARAVLYREQPHLDENSTFELTITVPVCRAPAANQDMIECADAAMRNAQFGYSGQTKRISYFLVNEAEAGALHTLQSKAHVFKREENFLLVDAGGGTTDLGLYRVTNEEPLRLSEEVNSPSGAMCGSSDLNERFRKLALLHLRGAIIDWYKSDVTTVDELVEEELVPRFEDVTKRFFSYVEKDKTFEFRVRGLRASRENSRLQNSKLVLDFDDMLGIFMPSLNCIANLVEDQIMTAHSKKIKVDKVVLIGGFGDSPALKEFLTQHVAKVGARTGHRVTTVYSERNTSAAGIAVGGVKRALDKRFGPARILQQSIGVIQHLVYDPKIAETYMHEQEREVSEVDGKTWVIKNTIKWLIFKSDVQPKSVHCVTMISEHEFMASEATWPASEVLYVSDECTECRWGIDHPKNRGKVKRLGEVDFDLTHLRPYHIKKLKKNKSKSRSAWKKQICTVTVMLLIEFIDRDLQFSVHWPAQKEAKALETSDQTFTIAAAFRPGTE